MAGIFGLLNIQDNSRAYVNTVGQELVFDAANKFLAMHNADMMKAFSVFIQEQTSTHKERYKLPGGGRLERRGGQAQSAAVKASGSWDVAYPLEDFGVQVAGDDVAMAYLTLPEMQLHLDNVTIRDINTVRYEILKTLFNSTAGTFVDPIWGSLTIERLANGDSVVYPPVLGIETEATDNHYLESGYAASGISDTNNPYITMRDELEEHFGTRQGGSNIVVFINNAQRAKTEALTDFISADELGVVRGNDDSRLIGLPTGVPGRIIGKASETWVSEWRWIPANYMVAIDLDQPAPLKMRIDPPDVNLQSGLHLKSTDAKYPLQAAHYRHRFGIGVGNRLNGVVMELGTGGTYSVPSGY